MNHLDHMRQLREADKKRFEGLDRDLCMVCGAHGADKRSLVVSTGYDMTEAVDRFIDLHLVEGRLNGMGYYLLICKSCRGEFIGMVRKWYESRRDLSQRYNLDHDGHVDDEEWESEERNVPVRVDGQTVMMTTEQFEEYNKRREQDKGD